MKTLRNVVASNIKHIVTEKLILNKSTSKESYNYYPENWNELKDLLTQLLKERGQDADLNDIDVSQITDMSHVFHDLDPHNIDISNWDVSNVTDMFGMFEDCENFNCDLSNWDVSKVKDMGCMFYNCKNFNCDLSKWDVSNVKNMAYMFRWCTSLKEEPEWFKF